MGIDFVDPCANFVREGRRGTTVAEPCDCSSTSCRARVWRGRGGGGPPPPPPPPPRPRAAGAPGLRPFLPPLVSGGLAVANVGVDYNGTEFAFLESPVFLVLIALAAAA